MKAECSARCFASRRIVFLIEAVVDLIRIGIVGSKVNDIADLIVNAVDFIWIPEPVFHLRRFAKNNEPRFFYGGIVIFLGGAVAL